jgi:hypothetical protein
LFEAASGDVFESLNNGPSIEQQHLDWAIFQLLEEKWPVAVL